MVESKQNHVRLVVTPASILQKSSTKSFQECREANRIDVLDLKALIVKNVGMQRANRYFMHFVRFLGSNLSKIELDKLVIATIGKKNVPLHNQLVRAILSNAVNGKAPPPLLPPSENFEKFSNKYHSPSVSSYRPHTSPSTLSNGDSFLSSPRSVKSSAHQNRDRDYRVSPLGHSEAHSAPNLFQSVQQPRAAAKQLDADSNSSLEPPLKRARVDCPASDDSASAIESEVLGGDEIDFHKEEREEVPFFGKFIRDAIEFSSHFDSGVSGKRPTFCAFPAHFLRHGGLENDIVGLDDLPDGDTMQSLVEQAAVHEGLDGASRESIDVLNSALDAYLKRLIKSCVSGQRAGPVNASTYPDCSLWRKNVNGGAMKLGQGVKGPCVQPQVDLVKIQHAQPSISLMNLKVAMDMNPQQLGGDWAVQLEKILFRLFDQ